MYLRLLVILIGLPVNADASQHTHPFFAFADYSRAGGHAGVISRKAVRLCCVHSLNIS